MGGCRSRSGRGRASSRSSAASAATSSASSSSAGAFYALKELPPRLAAARVPAARRARARAACRRSRRRASSPSASARRRGARGGPDHALPRVLAAVPPDPRPRGAARAGAVDPRGARASCSCACTSPGFFWGDCSLSNALFRRDAGALSAYLVDAETGELHEQLSDGQRAHDLEIAEENLAGELLRPRRRARARRRRRSVRVRRRRCASRTSSSGRS